MILKKMIVSIVFTAVSVCQVMASGMGSALIPHWNSHGTGGTLVMITNVSDVTVSGTLSMFNQKGELVNSPVDCEMNLNACNTSTPVMTFTLNAHETGYFAMRTSPNYSYGYGKITWNYDSNSQVAYPNKALMSIVDYHGPQGERTIFLVNDGNPF